jgi:hypothetical protein
MGRRTRFFINGCLALVLSCVPLFLSAQQESQQTSMLNHVRNGQFLLDTSNWRARYWHVAKLDYLLTEEIPLRTEIGPEGACLVATITEGSTLSVKIMSDIFPIRSGAPFQAELEIKSDEEGRSVEAVVFNETYKSSKPMVVGNAWQTISFNGLFPTGITEAARLEVRTSGKRGTIRLRRVSVRQPRANEPDYGIAEASVTPRHPLALSEQGDPVFYDIHSWSLSSPISLDWRLDDDTGKTVQFGRLELPKGVHLTPLSLGKPGLGWYTLHCSVAGPGMTPFHERHNLAVLPRVTDRPQVPLEQSRFGSHFELTKEGLLAARLMGSRWTRLNAPLITKWHAIEEVHGKPDYRDDAIAKLVDAGFGIVGTLDRTPKWASTGMDDPKTTTSNFYGAYAYFPKNWADWDRYVTDTVSRYQKKIHYWEIWNEPDIPFLVPPDGMSNAAAWDMLVRRTVPLVKKADPTASVLGGVANLKARYVGPGRQMDFPQECARLKTQTLLDIFTFHHYAHAGLDPQQELNDLVTTKPMLDRKGLHWWITEFGFSPPNNGRVLTLRQEMADPDLLQTAKRTAKFFVSNFAQGIERIFYYNAFFDTNGYEGFRNDVNVMWDAREPNPLVAAYSTLSWMLDGTHFESASEQDGIKVFTFRNAAQSTRVVWSDRPVNRNYACGKECVIRNIYGGKAYKGVSFAVSDSPTYVITDN